MTPRSPSRTILLVEDEALTAIMEKRLLEKYGYVVLIAGSGEKAIALADNTPGIDLILMDINLGGGLDGTEAGARILAKHDLPLVFLSSHTEREVVEKTEGITSYGYIVKNSGETVLIASVRMAFRLFEARAEMKRQADFTRAVMENLPLGIAVNSVDPEVEFGYMNRNFAAAYRTDPAALAAPDSFWEAVYPDPEFRENLKRRVVDDCASGDPERMRWDDIPIVRPGEPTAYVSARNIPVPGDDLMISTVWDVTERKAADERVQALLREKDLILKEAHHRVKNNMNAISGLLALAAEETTEPAARGPLLDAAGRAQAMLVLYDKLYRSADQRSMSLRDYLPSLVAEIAAVYPDHRGLSLAVEAEAVVVSPKLLSPLGIIVNELITNSIKYAFRGRRSGRIGLTARRIETGLELVYEDDGVGLPETVEPGSGTSFGLNLISLLLANLEGSMATERGEGARFVIRLPL